MKISKYLMMILCMMLSFGLVGCKNKIGKDENSVIQEENIEEENSEEVKVRYYTIMQKGVYPSGAFYWEEWKRDRKGNLQKIIVYNEEGEILRWTDCINNDKGNCVKRVHYDQQGNVTSTSEYEYDKDEYLIKISYFDTTGADGWHEFENDVYGNMIGQAYYDENGSIRSWQKYEIDENGNKVEEKIFHYREGEEGDKEVNRYEYDEDGNLVKSMHYNEDGSIGGCEVYEYDEYNRQTKITYYSGNEGSIRGWDEYTYYIIDQDKQKTRKTIMYKYDSYGKEIVREETEVTQETVKDILKWRSETTRYESDGTTSSWWEESEHIKIKVK